MPKKDGIDDFVISDHGNWNVAADYSKLKLMKPLYLADEFETIATFGFLDFYEETENAMNIDFIKIRGFKRLINTLLMLINNSKFAVGKDKTILEGYEKELKKFQKITPLLYFYKRNEQKKTKELLIKPEKYNLALDRIIEIKALINEPLNKHDLIFTHKEDFDPARAKQDIKERLTNIG